MNKDIENLPFKIGDKVTGLKISDFLEDQEPNSLERVETIRNIESDGGDYYYITTDFTEKVAKEIEKENKNIEDEENQTETKWYINASNAQVRIVNEIEKTIDLSEIGGKVDGDYISFDHVEIPMTVLKSLTPFIREIQNKDVEEVIDIEDEISIIISGVEFKPSILKTILDR